MEGRLSFRAGFGAVNLEYQHVYEKHKNVSCGKIDPDPYAKRIAGGVTATPVPETDRVSRASRARRAIPFGLLKHIIWARDVALMAPLIVSNPVLALEKPPLGT
jgi:hypothetical protein